MKWKIIEKKIEKSIIIFFHPPDRGSFYYIVKIFQIEKENWIGFEIVLFLCGAHMNISCLDLKVSEIALWAHSLN